MIAREGFTIIAITWVVVLLITVLVWIVPEIPSWICFFVSLAVLLGPGLFVLCFFRDPLRTPPPGVENLLLSPADGKIIAIEQVQEPLFLEGLAQRVSIFLSPFDVHVNRVPASGVIEMERYIPGKYLFAWHPKASEENERSVFGLRHETGQKVLFNQIAGGVARRIVYHIGVADSVQAGQRYGIIKFGSRMDVYVSPDVPLVVRTGDRVRAGESILGHLDSLSVGPSLK